MTVSSETVFSVLIGGVISGLTTWLVAHAYFRKQDSRAEQIFEMIVRTVQRLVLAVEAEAQTHFQVVRDAKGRITDVKVLLIQGYAPEVHIIERGETRNSTEQADDLMS